jgi:ribosome-associated translation inhibitor RaiA
MKTEKETTPEVQDDVQKETTQEIQTLKVELTVIEWNAIYSVIEKSTSPYIQVNTILNELDKQLKPQIKDDK